LSNATIPKEKQTAYQRWEMSSFAADSAISGQRNLSISNKSQEDARNDQKLAAILESVRKEGFTKGMQEGFTVGMEQAKQQIQQEREDLQALMHGFGDALKAMDEQISGEILTLALDISKAMLKLKLQVNPEVIIPIVRDAIRYFPHLQSSGRILVHPEDAKLLRAYMADELAEYRWKVQEDHTVERGGCVVETQANEIDATNETRWKRIMSALSQQDQWLATEELLK
jgi:flagellar assembly protein FliH